MSQRISSNQQGLHNATENLLHGQLCGGGIIAPGHGGIIAPGHGGIIAPGHGGIIAPGHGGIIAPGHGGIIAPGHGDIIAPGHGGSRQWCPYSINDWFPHGSVLAQGTFSIASHTYVCEQINLELSDINR